MASELLLSLRNYKAIFSADIRIGSMTIVAGPNGSGKSTISRAVHSICNMSIMYRQYADRHAWTQIAKLVGKIIDLGRCLQPASSVSAYNAKASSENQGGPDFEDMVKTLGFDKTVKAVSDYVDKTFDLYSRGKDEASSRAFSALVAACEMDMPLVGEDAVRIVVHDKLNAAGRDYSVWIQKREYEVYNEASQEVRTWLASPGYVCLSENNAKVYETNKDDNPGIAPAADLKEIFGVTRALYITSPLVSTPVLDKDGRIGFNDGFTFKAEEKEGFDGAEFFSVMRGRVDSEDAEDFVGGKKWVYHRADGLTVDIDACATGLRSFSILQILCKYQLLDEGTLLIVDEPEAHLHPKWIVEYARTLVGLVGKYKIRLLIATHSPYFLNAIEHFVSAERIGNEVRFYEMTDSDGQEKAYVAKDVSDNPNSIYKSMYEPFAM